jgi:hypothetical protein
MYRKSDELCTGDDAAPESEKYTEFRTDLDCLSESSSQMLLSSLKPRLIISGHTHHGCLYHHKGADSSSIPEVSVPSYSWRNRDNPSFFLVSANRIEKFIVVIKLLIKHTNEGTRTEWRKTGRQIEKYHSPVCLFPYIFQKLICHFVRT